MTINVMRFLTALSVLTCGMVLIGCGNSVVGTNATPTPTYFTVDTLGHLAGGAGMQANDLNDLGEVVGGTDDAAFNMHAFTWTKGGGLVDLGRFGGLSGYVQSVNNAGDLAGMFTPNGVYIKSAWTSIGGSIAYPGLPSYIINGGAQSYDQVTVSGMTNDGQVVMEAYISEGSYVPSAAFAYSGGQFNPIGEGKGTFLSFFSRASIALLVMLARPPDRPRILGNGAGAPRFLCWKSAYQALGGRLAGGGANGEALGTLTNGHAGFLSADGATATDLGRAGTVYALNAAGQAVGGYTDTTSHLKGFYWTKSLGFQDLTS